MKILRISLRNIASLAGEHTVDFTKPPLVNAGLFSISGPMGAGKSTLLDALCLALYDATPRLEVVQGNEAVDDKGKAVQLKDVRNLLRRGCGEGYAEAAFVGLDGLAYTARWVVRRARNGAGGSLQKSEHILFKGNIEPGSTGEVAAGGTATDVRKFIVGKVGLTFEQFRRAVLLAQGDFATFLKSKDTERAEILQALTGTERFEQISKAVFQRNKMEEAKVAELKHKLGAAMPLSEEERAAAEEELLRAVAVKEELQRQLEERKKQEEWFLMEAGRKKEWEEALAKVREGLEQEALEKTRAKELQWIVNASVEARPKRSEEQGAKSALESATDRMVELRREEGFFLGKLKGAREMFAASSHALDQVVKRQRDAAEDLAKARLLDGELIPLEAAAALADKEHAGALGVFSKAEQELTLLHAELAKLKDSKQALQQRLSKAGRFEVFAPDVDVWLERFKTEAKSRAKKNELHVQLGKASREVAKTAQQLQEKSATLPALRAAAKVAETAMQEARVKVESFPVENIMSARRNAIASQVALQELKTHLDTQKHLHEEREKSELSLKKLEVEIEAEVLKKADLCDVQIPAARHALERAQESLHLAEAAVSEHAGLLRAALISGGACPVCGSLEHPNADGGNSPEKAVLAALKGDVRSKDALLRKRQADLSGVDVLLQEHERQAAELRLGLQSLEGQLKTSEAYKPMEAEAMEVWKKRGEQQRLDLERRQAAVSEALKALDQKDEERLAAEKALKAGQVDFEKRRDVLLKAETAETDARNQSENAGANCERIRNEMTALEGEHGVAFGVISPVLLALKAQAGTRSKEAVAFEEYDYENDPEDYVDWYEAQCREWNTVKGLLDEECRREASRLEQLEPSKNNRNESYKALLAREEEQKNARGYFGGKKAARAALLGGRSVREFEKAIAGEFEEASKAAEDAGKKQAEVESGLGTLRGLLEEHQKQVETLEAKLRAATAAMDNWLQGFHEREGRETNRTAVDEWLSRDAQWMEREQRKLDATAARLASARGQEETTRKQYDAHLQTKTTQDGHETVKAEILRLNEEAKAAGEVADATRAVVVNDQERNRQTGELRKNLQTQEALWLPWQKLNVLIGSADGTKFRNIAQQWTLEILLKHANAQLKMLSGRYRLERLRESLNLMVEDLAMDGQQRSVHSLSGGESFLVSLGLALGLASLTSSRLRIESLFIDEGFGSLDAETLRVALNALSHLESQGRKVGVISHVSEMVDVIPVQVRVVRGAGGASKIVV